MFQDAFQTSSYCNTVLNDCTEIVDTGFSFAFQPIVEVESLNTTGHEALVRGLAGESAASVINAIRPENRYYFDQACRMRALQAAAERGIDSSLHLNCSQISPDNLAHSLEATAQCAQDYGIAAERIVLEFGSLEMLGNPRQLDKTRQMAQAAGMRVLADNIGAGEVGLKRLAVFRPDFVKLDRSLVRNICDSTRRQAIVHGVIATARALGLQLIATGIERKEELEWLKDAGLKLAQGFYFAHPSFKPVSRAAA